MKKKILFVIGLVLISILLLCGCTEPFSGTGVITDKWSKIVDADFGAREAYFFEMDNEYFIEVNAFDYHNYEINQAYSFKDKIRSPDI